MVQQCEEQFRNVRTFRVNPRPQLRAGKSGKRLAYFLEGSGEVYPVFSVKTFHGHIIKTVPCKDKSTTTLHHSNSIAMV